MLNYILILNQLYSILVCLWGGNRIISDMMVLNRDASEGKITYPASNYPVILLFGRIPDIYGYTQNALSYPNLVKVAIKYLGTPPSSVYSERLFSSAGIVFEERRKIVT